MLITKIKAIFQCFFCLFGLVCPVSSGVVAVPLPWLGAPRGPGQHREAPGRETRRRKRRPSRQENCGEAGTARRKGPWGQGSGSGGLEKARRGREGRVHLRTCPSSRSWPFWGMGPLFPAWAVCSGLGAGGCDCGCRRKEPVLKCRSCLS